MIAVSLFDCAELGRMGQWMDQARIPRQKGPSRRSVAGGNCGAPDWHG